MVLAERLANDLSFAGRAFNFSTESPMTVVEIVDATRKAMGSELLPTVLNEANNEIPEQHLDSTLARELLGWRPTYGLEEGLDRTVSWYRGYVERQGLD
jgi:CDP-glucose 4,6-dehydratase